MNRTMLARITAMMLAVILLLTTAIGLLGWKIIRDRRLADRLDMLTRDARQIAYLAAQNSGPKIDKLQSPGSTLALLRTKAQQVYDDYGAYILVLDARGHIMDNFTTAYAENPDFVNSLDQEDLQGAFQLVLDGQQIAVRTDVNHQPSFTVGVPFIHDGHVLGAVLIQTDAQNVEGGLGDWLVPLGIGTVAAVVVATVLMLLFLRSTLHPLRDLTAAARAMTGGDFSMRVEPQRAAPEIEELATAFNTMAGKLQDVERSRREFVANVSHELRSPITSIAGFIGGMEDGTIPAEQHPRYLKLVNNETQRLSALIAQLLQLSRLERDDAVLDWSDFDLCELLRRAVIRRINDLERRNMEVSCEFDPDPCMVHADQNRIEQVVINLMDNAIRFTPDNGHITLSVCVEGDTVLMRVRDDGVGILPEDAPHIFERFFTADRAHTAGKGTGLGLAISQRIMEMHHQKISL